MLLQFRLQLDQVLLQIPDLKGGLLQLFKSALEPLPFLVDLVLLLVEQFYEELEHIEVGLGGVVDFALEDGLEFAGFLVGGDVHFLADVCEDLQDVCSLGEVVIRGQVVVFDADGGGHAHEGLLRPGEEPVDGAAVDQGGELAAADPKGVADGAHRQDDV